MAAGAYEQGGGLGAAAFIKLKDGKNYVRILPPWTLEAEYDDFCIERRRHFGVGPDNRPATCPKTAGDRVDCVVCDRSKSLRDAGDKREAGSLSARWRYLMNAVELAPGAKSAPKEAKILDVGKTIIREIVQYFDDTDEWGNMWGENLGKKGVYYDFIITKSGAGFDTDYKVRPTRKFSALANSAELLKSMRDLEAEFKIPTPGEIEKLFLGEEPADEDEKVDLEDEDLEDEDEDEDLEDEDEDEDIEDEDEDLEDEDEDEDEDLEDEDEDLEDEDEDLEDEDEDEDFEDEDEDEDLEDEDEEQPASRPKKKSPPKRPPVKQNVPAKKPSTKKPSTKKSGTTRKTATKKVAAKKGTSSKSALEAKMKGALKKGRKK